MRIVIGLFALFLMASALPLHAKVSPEIGVGLSHAIPRNNGTWYQKGFPYRLRLNNSAVLAGVRYDSGPWTAHLDAVWLGSYSSDSRDIPVDSNYNAATHTCNGPCLPLAHYQGRGWAGGVKFTGGWHTSGTWQFGVQVGPMAYREAWRLNVPNWYSPTRQSDGSWIIGPIIPIRTSDQHWSLGWTAGASITHGSWSLNLDWYRDGKSFSGHNGIWPPIWRQHLVLSLTFAF